MNEVLLGIDAGTSAIKVCAFDAKGSLLKKVQRFVPIITPYPLWAEIDLQRYWELLVQALHEVSMQTGPITSVGLSTTCPTTIFLDKNLKPLRHAMVYLDGRSDEIIGKVTGSDMLAFQKISGNRASTSTCSRILSFFIFLLNQSFLINYQFLLLHYYHRLVFPF